MSAGIVVTGGGPVGGSIVKALRAMGTTVGVVDVDGSADKSGGPVASASYRDIASVKAAFGQLAASLGPVDFVVHAAVPVEAFRVRALIEYSEAQFEALAEHPILEAIYSAQAAFEVFAGRGGHLVFVVPNVGITGGAGLAPAASWSEGVHLLTKTAGRQWGQHQITANCVMAPAATFVEDAGLLEGLAGMPAVTPWGPALGRGPDPVTDIGNAVSLLLDKRASFITGTAINLDGGELMR